MEFHEKLQALRKQKGLTQEELAGALYVSRTAISKWESARGYPNIESLKAIAKFFSVTIDELLSGDELLTLAESDQKQAKTQLHDLVFGLLDCSVAALLFLPLFGQASAGSVAAVSLLALTEIQPYLKTLYTLTVAGSILLGLLTLALQGRHILFWARIKRTGSLLWSALGVLLFIGRSQPYAAALFFLFLAFKVVLLLKQR